MTEDKHIEELIATIEITKELCDSCCDICKMHGKGCMPERMAKKLAQKGYRKASDLAREIFEEIEEIAMHSITSFGLQTMVMGEVAFAELKKKYTESENNDG